MYYLQVKPSVNLEISSEQVFRNVGSPFWTPLKWVNSRSFFVSFLQMFKTKWNSTFYNFFNIFIAFFTFSFRKKNYYFFHFHVRSRHFFCSWFILIQYYTLKTKELYMSVFWSGRENIIIIKIVASV